MKRRKSFRSQVGWKSFASVASAAVAPCRQSSRPSQSLELEGEFLSRSRTSFGGTLQGCGCEIHVELPVRTNTSAFCPPQCAVRSVATSTHTLLYSTL